MADQNADGTIRLEPIRIGTIQVPVRGVTPLIVHAFGEKARKMMQDQKDAKAGKIAKAKRMHQSPEEEYEAGFYRLPDGRYGMPAAAFKIATITGARSYEAITMASLKAAVVFWRASSAG